MENKYYIPEVEELHFGMELQHNNCKIDSVDEDYKDLVISHTNIESIHYDLTYKNSNKQQEEKARNNSSRVKYLDKKDIESLGFVVKEEVTKSYGYYITAIIKHEGYTTTLTYSFLKGKDKVYIHLSNSHYSGNGHYYIKNKSELSKLLKQLNIMK